jgi:predicted glycosyltransferase
VRVLIDVMHPAHVHFFRNFHDEMHTRGHDVLITARAKDRSLELLDAYGLSYRHLSTQTATGRAGPKDLLQHTRGLLRVMREFRPDAMTAIGGPAIALAGKLRRKPAVVFYDTEFAVHTNTWVYPLATSVVTPDSYQGRVRGRHLTYAGYHELAYLHPARFTPDERKLDAFGVRPDDAFSIVRFV